ncbi:hypothetical protein EYF80_000859 [Liparis tanakae]|uniref:Uncharacterized protein n=1 Tax=Liparis tanakae TaxID=230148 RepID=A0A4Z2JG86_9TELE|nr:hypothetical protein EYF80_000859 [Liparis tanakae]
MLNEEDAVFERRSFMTVGMNICGARSVRLSSGGGSIPLRPRLLQHRQTEGKGERANTSGANLWARERIRVGTGTAAGLSSLKRLSSRSGPQVVSASDIGRGVFAVTLGVARWSSAASLLAWIATQKLQNVQEIPLKRLCASVPLRPDPPRITGSPSRWHRQAGEEREGNDLMAFLLEAWHELQAALSALKQLSEQGLDPMDGPIKQYILNVTHACSSQDVDSLVHAFIREVS